MRSLYCSQICSVLAATIAWTSLATADQPHAPGSAVNVPVGQTASPRVTATSGLETAKSVERLREGTRLIDVSGTFQSVGGDNVAFSPAASGNKDSFRVLQNLALERISTALEANRGARQWIVSGTITEFRGSNYLLVTKAVIQLQEGDSAASEQAFAAMPLQLQTSPRWGTLWVLGGGFWQSIV